MILVCDDDKAIRTSLSFVLGRKGYEVVCADNPDDIISFVRKNKPQLVLLDMNYSTTTSGTEGLELLRKIRILAPDTPVILMTAWGTIELAVKGMREGAFDFVTKPWHLPGFLQTVESALSLSEGAPSSGEQTVSDEGVIELGDGRIMICASVQMKKITDMARRAALTEVPILITGESGTGKELLAEFIHRSSRRAGNPFVKVNLGGISDTLFESEMFGHRKGSFTDAKYDRVGRFKAAEKGTIFLDEIGELENSSQVKLLRVLQDRTYEVLGDSRTLTADVRVVSATNRNLAEEVARNCFREDLFYRINVLNIHIPPLRERPEDVAALAKNFMNEIGKDFPGVELTGASVDFLKTLPLSGNARELRNLIQRSALYASNGKITPEDLRASQTNTDTVGKPLSPTTIQQEEIRSINGALRAAGGNISRAAKILGISRQALYRRMEKYGIDTEENNDIG